MSWRCLEWWAATWPTCGDPYTDPQRAHLEIFVLCDHAVGICSALAPGVLSGATVAMFILNREKIAMGRSTAIVIITAFFDNLFYVLMIPLVFLFVSSDFCFLTSDQCIGAAATRFLDRFQRVRPACAWCFT